MPNIAKIRLNKQPVFLPKEDVKQHIEIHGILFEASDPVIFDVIWSLIDLQDEQQ